jgi:hypothetical protein
MKVEVITSGIVGCSNCEAAKELVRRVLKDYPAFEFGEIDSLEEPERILSLGMVTSGAIVINNKLEYSRLPKEKILRDRLLEILKADGMNTE